MARGDIGYPLRRQLRRPLRGVSRGGGVRVSQRPPLPATAVEYWHGELGASAANAVGQIQGITLVGTNTPVVAQDGSFFNSRNVYQASSSSNRCWRATGLATVLTSGTRPWVYTVGRFRSVAGTQTMTVICRGATSDNCNLQVAAGVQRVQFDSGILNSSVGPDTNAHRFKAWRDGTNRNFTVDATNTAAADVTALSQNVDQLTLGCARDAAIGYDVSIAFHLLCSAQPSAGEEAALDAWSLAYWGV